MLHAAFYIAKPAGLYEQVISLVAGTPTHCELVFSDGLWFSSSNRDGGCRFKEIDASLGSWTFLPLPDVVEGAVREFCENQEGKGYDWVGVFLGWFGANDPKRWFCSEVCTAALSFGKYDLGLIPSSTTPKRLFDCIMSQTGQEVVII